MGHQTHTDDRERYNALDGLKDIPKNAPIRPITAEGGALAASDRLIQRRQFPQQPINTSARGTPTAYAYNDDNPSDSLSASPVDSLSRSVGSEQSAEALTALWMGDLEEWMDENYIRRCISAMQLDRDENGQLGLPVMIKMQRSRSGADYCLLSFPAPHHAQNALSLFASRPPTFMPGSERTFKLTWAHRSKSPPLQPYLLVSDLSRDITEAEIVALFSPLFTSCQSAKIVTDPFTGGSKSYGFLYFSDEVEMAKALAFGQAGKGNGLALRGKPIRISDATGASTAPLNRFGAHSPADVSNGSSSYQEDGLRSRISPTVSSFASSPLPTSTDSELSNGPFSPVSPRSATTSSSDVNLLTSSFAGMSLPAHAAGPPITNNANDPNNTTVFVGGLPACISEETLRNFFQHFGDITYVKIPPNKGCGFVQFVRRQDAELAILKMHDFPIHGKSRIRLSWGRSQGDKQVEHVKKLANALGIPFESVWRMVQGQDNSTIKQIASAVGNGANVSAGGRRGPALPAGLTALDINAFARSNSTGYEGASPASIGGYRQQAAVDPSIYSRVSPSTFTPFNAQNHLAMPGGGTGPYGPYPALAGQPAHYSAPGHVGHNSYDRNDFLRESNGSRTTPLVSPPVQPQYSAASGLTTPLSADGLAETASDTRNKTAMHQSRDSNWSAFFTPGADNAR
ncbi:uncharacterized protein L969DRAFT_152926 [Mixia osmundae IAM 14324]|uniref:RRM domain-containing protein n=1 Tax=Mixia osmundae (strain CBS 9802 / IAM 14324 / JCM 22182 / KY 12970) TaxID=764103 RepID=G7E351_MIXOS|nr:uncharacterized protein L969DRAFT_152926 [Mixia osmundae IAM 14324]KEI42483.1 hypothetical protein L969DRAFT_152926 [Mixia osmundae IAM 14324]GAA97232.1 hypothetical protein E5Q_03908 [Mixia osmundae IAM 14324]